jgi:hypothetical protein
MMPPVLHSVLPRRDVDPVVAPPVLRAFDTLVLGAACLVIVLGFITGCPGPGPAPVPVTASCETSCDHLRAMHCKEGDPTPRGGTCEEVCRVATANGVDFIRCAFPAQDCAALAGCVH